MSPMPVSILVISALLLLVLCCCANGAAEESSAAIDKPLNNQELLSGRKKENRYLWPLGTAIAILAATTFGIFLKIVWSVSMLSSLMSVASIILSGILSFGKTYYSDRRNGFDAAASNIIDIGKRMDLFDYGKYAAGGVKIGDARDFTTEYSAYRGYEQTKRI